MQVGQVFGELGRAEVGGGEGGSICGEGLVGEEVGFEVEEAEADVEIAAGSGGDVDDLEVIGGLVELEVQGFAGMARGEKGGVGFEVVGVELPDETGLGGVGNPGDDAGDGVEEFGEAALVHGTVGLEGGELAFAGEVLVRAD